MREMPRQNQFLLVRGPSRLSHVLARARLKVWGTSSCYDSMIDGQTVLLAVPVATSRQKTPY